VKGRGVKGRDGIPLAWAGVDEDRLAIGEEGRPQSNDHKGARRKGANAPNTADVGLHWYCRIVAALVCKLEKNLHI